VQQDIYIYVARAFWQIALASHGVLHCQSAVEQPSWQEGGFHLGYAVEKVCLRTKVHGRRLIQRGHTNHAKIACVQPVDGGLQIVLPIAQVRPETEIGCFHKN
jgi:hypothetical protein